MKCPSCAGTGQVEIESDPVPTPDGPYVTRTLDTCQECGGSGEIEVYPITEEDLPP